MARYKYSENTKEVTDIYFDTETHGEYMGMEQDGEMKHLKGPTLKSAIEDVAKDVAKDGSYDNTDSGLVAETIKDAIDEVAGEIDTLNADDTTEGSVAKTVKDAVDPVKGTGWTDENLVDHESRIGDLETNDTLQDATLGTLKETVLTTKLAVNELERQAQIGNGATLDFSDVGIVPLDARATGRANPTVEGLTVANMSKESKIFITTSYRGYLSWYQLTQGHKYYISIVRNLVSGTDNNASGQLRFNDGVGGAGLNDFFVFNSLFGSWERVIVFNHSLPSGSYQLSVYGPNSPSTGTECVWSNFIFLDLTSTFGAGNEPSEADCAKIFSYFDGTKSISMPARLRSVGKNFLNYANAINGKYLDIDKGSVTTIFPERSYDPTYYEVPFGTTHIGRRRTGSTNAYTLVLHFYNSQKNWLGRSLMGSADTNTTPIPVGAKYVRIASLTNKDTVINTYLSACYFLTNTIVPPYEPYTDSTLYIADNEEVRSIQDVQDTLTMVNGEYIYTKKMSTPASVASGVAVNVTNYPTAKTGGKFAVELTAGGTQIGVIGTDSTSGAGMLRYELNTPVITNLLTSGTLKAFQNGTVYFEPYYEGSHQTNASSQITLPYEGTIEAVYGYDDDLVEYLLDSSEYTLVGTTLTITDALENEVFFVQMSRSEPLAPEMSVNVLNNEQVIADTENGKFYKLVPTITDGVLVSQIPVEVV